MQKSFFLCRECSIWTFHVETYGDMICPSLSCDYINNFALFFCLRCRRTAWNKTCWLQYFPPFSHYLKWAVCIATTTHNNQPGSTKNGWKFLLENIVILTISLFSVCDRVCDQMLFMLSLYWHWGELVWLGDRLCKCGKTARSWWASWAPMTATTWLRRLWSGGTSDKGHPAGLNHQEHFFRHEHRHQHWNPKERGMMLTRA